MALRVVLMVTIVPLSHKPLRSAILSYENLEGLDILVPYRSRLHRWRPYRSHLKWVAILVGVFCAVLWMIRLVDEYRNLSH